MTRNSRGALLTQALAWVCLAVVGIIALSGRFAAVFLMVMPALVWWVARRERFTFNEGIVLPLLLMPGLLIGVLGLADAIGFAWLTEERALGRSVEPLRVLLFGCWLAAHALAMWRVMIDEVSA